MGRVVDGEGDREWSYGLLDAEERAAFEQLSGFTADAATAVLPVELGGISTSARLVDTSLVVSEPGDGGARYRMFGTLKEFAGEKLAAAGAAESARGTHLAWRLQLIDRLERRWVRRSADGARGDFGRPHEQRPVLVEEGDRMLDFFRGSPRIASDRGAGVDCFDGVVDGGRQAVPGAATRTRRESLRGHRHVLHLVAVGSPLLRRPPRGLGRESGTELIVQPTDVGQQFALG